MYEWHRQIQQIIDAIEESIRRRDDEALTLQRLSALLGYSAFYTTRKFRDITGLSLRAYLTARKLAFALIEVRDTDRSLLDIAVDYGFSSNEAFTRAFRAHYGVTPSAYRKHPCAVVLRVKMNPYDRYALGMKEIGMNHSDGKINVYFSSLPAHKYLHVRNDHSNGYWDFWQKQAERPGQDCDTICGLLDSIPGKLDDMGDSDISSGSGQIMGYINDPAADRFDCWPVNRAEHYGVRLPADYAGPVPESMILTDVPEAEYLVFEHGPFDYDQENCTVEGRIAAAQAAFSYEGTGYEFDPTPGRMMYFYHDPLRCWKELWPVRRV